MNNYIKPTIDDQRKLFDEILELVIIKDLQSSLPNYTDKLNEIIPELKKKIEKLFSMEENALKNEIFEYALQRSGIRFNMLVGVNTVIALYADLVNTFGIAISRAVKRAYQIGIEDGQGLQRMLTQKISKDENQ